jgi:arabinan endo-1,5-alpha-L-arabinosidase
VTADGRGRRAAAGVLLAAAVLTGCGDEGSTGAAASSSPAESSPTADAGPVIDQDFPDPDVLEVEDTYYAYATNSGTDNVQVATSTDLESWEVLGDDALPELPSWVIPGKTWAPEVTQIGSTFVMYTTTTNFDPTLQCIAVATSDAPEGPFELVGDEMLVCPEDEGGAIDASTFLDEDGTRYLLWKNDGNCCGLDTWLQIAPLSDDGLTLAGETTKLVKQDQPWEGNLVEAPTLVERDGTYVLLYSANDYGSDAYAVGYATADSPTGPFTKAEEPLLTTDASEGRFVGPGGQDVVTAPDGTDRLVIHSWDVAFLERGMHVVPLEWEDGEPVVVLDES